MKYFEKSAGTLLYIILNQTIARVFNFYLAAKDCQRLDLRAVFHNLQYDK